MLITILTTLFQDGPFVSPNIASKPFIQRFKQFDTKRQSDIGAFNKMVCFIF